MERNIFKKVGSALNHLTGLDGLDIVFGKSYKSTCHVKF